MHQTKTGILLANLGTPDAPTPGAVKRYLRQFLSDKRVVDTSRLLWWPLLRGVILPIRSPRVAKLYQSVWMEEGSPLMVYSRRQQQALAARLPDTPVALGMSYGSPSLASAVDDLLAQGVEHIVVLPLYPQYSCSTVAAVWDELARILAKNAPFRGSRLFATMPIARTISMRWRPACAPPSRCMVNPICCCSPIMGSRSAMPTRGMTILSAVAIPRGSWSRRWGCAGAGDDDLPVALWPRTLADALHR